MKTFLKLSSFVPFMLMLALAGQPVAFGSSRQASTTPEIVEKTVSVGGYGLFFRIIPGQGLTILLESGGGGDSTEWLALMPRLAKDTGATIVAYDRAGFGRSDLPETKYDLHVETEGLWRALLELGLDRNLILVGHSFGGMLIRFEAAEHPDAVRGLVFVDPFTVELVDAMGLERCLQHPMIGKLPFDTSRPETLTKKQRAMLRMNVLEENCAHVRNAAVPAGIPVRILTSGLPWLVPEEMKAWRDSHERFAASIPGATLIVAEKSHHLIPQLQPDLVASVVAEVVRAAK